MNDMLSPAQEAQLLNRSESSDREIAYEALRTNSSQDERYWADISVPIRPDGRVDLEPLWQIAVFAVPVWLMMEAYLAFGIKGLFFSGPFAILFGWLQGSILADVIRKKEDEQCERDRGRYRIVQKLSQSFDIEPHHVTLPLVRALAALHRDELNRRAQAEHLAAQRHAEQGRQKASRSHGDRVGRNPSMAVTAVAAGTLDDEDFRREDEYHHQPNAYDYNPASGLPMVGDFGGVDVIGNPYGTNYHD